MDLEIIYEDNDLLVADKPAGVVVFAEGKNEEKTLIDHLLEKNPDLKNVGEAPRYGIVHRLDKDTSGILLVAKSTKALIFLQKQFSAHTFSSLEKSGDGSAQSEEMGGKNGQTLENTIEKRYIALVNGVIKEEQGIIHTLIGRSKSDPRKQKATWLKDAKPDGKREAITLYKVLQRFKDYTLLEVQIKTGRKHQIRCHLSYIHHPIAGDNVYGFKDSPTPEGLNRQFLHASDIKIQLPARNALGIADAGGPSGQMRDFHSDLPEDLQNTLKGLASRV